MKTIIFTLIATSALTATLNAQEQTVKVNPAAENAVFATDTIEPVQSSDTVIYNDDYNVDNSVTIDSLQATDTTIIRIGKKEIKVIDNDNDDHTYWCNGKQRKNRSGKFDGHWEAIELGFNNFDKPDYDLYDGNEFMSLNQGKSMEVNVNFYELNIGLAKSYVGLVSGLGLSFNSYRFENPYTIVRGPQRTEPVALDFEDLSKTKLAVSYLKVPLLLEFQIPVNQREGRLYVNAGVVGGVKIGSHTKVKHGDTKDKDRSGFYINNFNYAATARVGYKDMGLFATYNLTPLFETGKGPELTPFTIGISFSN